MLEKRPLTPLKIVAGKPLFVAGTDTEVGKTYIAASLIRRIRQQGFTVAGYKPVASGCQRDADGKLISLDAVALWQAAGQADDLETVCPQRFELPIAPPAAAERERRSIDIGLMIDGARRWVDHRQIVVVEGAGGLMSPLAERYYNADLARDMAASIVIVAANRLGVINHTLQTIITARSYGLSIVAVVLNQATPTRDPSTPTNADSIRQFDNAPPVFEVAHNREIELDIYLGG